MYVVYRACSKGNPLKERPIKDKFELVKVCFSSFLRAFRGVDYKLTILLDKPNSDFRELFKGYDVEESYYSDFTEGNTKSFHRQIDLALKRKDKFFFIEDDYFFLPSAGKILSKVDLPFFTPYDHPRYYDEEIHKYKKDVVISGNHHWQSVISTTLTFGGRYESLVSEADTMKKYGWMDHSMWCDITQRASLFSAVPSLATHMETPHLAPLIKWDFSLQTPLTAS